MNGGSLRLHRNTKNQSTEIKMKKLFILILICNLFSIVSAQEKIDGYWKGNIYAMEAKFGIEIKFRTENDSMIATIDIPEQGADDLKLVNVSLNDNLVHFELETGAGSGIFDGIFYGDSISGAYKQSGLDGTFLLNRAEEQIVSKEELPYNSEEVIFKNGDISFAGTLTTPKTPGKHPAVILITGSGPQNRDEDIFGFKVFGKIADFLTRNGIAVLRYDDRNTGGSTGPNVSESTTEDFAVDVISAVEFLKSRNEINESQIGLFGHSEGGIVAPLVASKSGDIAYIILMAGTGVKGIDIIKEQSKLIMKTENSSDDEIKGYKKMLDKIYKTLKAGNDLTKLEKDIRKNVEENYEQLPEDKKKFIPDKEQYIDFMVKSTIEQFGSPWMKYFLLYDPAPTLSKVKCPVLLLFGELDLQVPYKQNKEPMEKALVIGGNKDFKTIVFPSANHLFQKAATGSPSEYSKLEKEFVDGFLDAIKYWILERVTLER